MKVPLVDLKVNAAPLKADILARLSRIIDNCNFILGDEVAELEKNFARYCNSAYAVGVANGTEAIHLALRAAGIGPGDEVIIPANTFIATALGVSYTGAVPRPVDIDERTFLIDTAAIEQAVTPRTRAIIPVHLYGRLCDMDSVNKIAQANKLLVIEDAAQAHGAESSGYKAGNSGVAGCFSFYPGKNLGAFGDGGLVTTSDEKIYGSLLALRNYGSTKKYHHPIKGYNCRLDTMQAAVLSAKLPNLDRYNSQRYEIACRYNQMFEKVGDLILPAIPEKGSHVFHLYVIRTKKRDKLLQHLNDSGIGAGIHYPTPIHLHSAFKDLNFKHGDFKIAERICNEILSLPLYPELNEEQFDYIVNAVVDFYK